MPMFNQSQKADILLYITNISIIKLENVMPGSWKSQAATL